MTENETKTAVVVGNGRTIRIEEMGEVIDSFDEVYRFNCFQTEGYEEFVGYKTTHWVVNEGSDTLDKLKLEIRKKEFPTCDFIVSPNYNKNDDKNRLYKTLRTRDIHLRDTNQWKYIKKFDNEKTLISRDSWKKAKRRCGVSSPSTGIVLIQHLIDERYKKIYIYGFDAITRVVTKRINHYWEAKNKAKNTIIHEIQKEKEYILKLVDHGLVEILYTDRPGDIGMDYEKYHKMKNFQNIGKFSWNTKGEKKGEKVLEHYEPHLKILDFGCGTGYALRRLRKHFSTVWGYEYSRTAYTRYLKKDKNCFFRLADTLNLNPDILYSTEVLEHIPSEDIPFYMQYFKRLSPTYIFMTISLRPSSENNKFHCTLHPREWWDEHFRSIGYVQDDEIFNKCQVNKGRADKQIFSKWAKIGKVGEEFRDNPPYSLNGEEEPWFFIYRKNDET